MANRIPQSFIDQVLARTDIVELIDSAVPLKKSASNNFTACCPFHQENTPSFTVSQTKQFYHCFGCGVSGNAISFLMEYERLSFLEAIEQLAKTAALPLPVRDTTQATQNATQKHYDLLAFAAKYYQQQLQHHPEASAAVDYLKGRGITGESARNFKLGFAPEGWDNVQKACGSTFTAQDLITVGLSIQKENGSTYDRFRNRIVFPITDRRGRVIGFGGRIIDAGEPKYLNSPETPFFQKGHELYGLYEARKLTHQLTPLIIVEGYLDVIALSQAGIHAVVATLGTATTAHHLTHLFRQSQEIIFCFEGLVIHL